MAISAVPGAGKTHSLAVAAAIAIARYQLSPRKQLVIVTYTRSAAANIKAKVKENLVEKLSLPIGGFNVHTLHGLALNIASRNRDLSNLNLDTANLITPNPEHRLIKVSVEQWINANPLSYQRLLEGKEFDGEETERLRRQSALRTEILPYLAHIAIREAKSSGLSPQDLYDLSQQTNDEYNILRLAAGLYENYEKTMQTQNFIDYDDMILAALRVLENPAIRQSWQNQIFGVFEDEAQDSSPLQEKLISILARDGDNPDRLPNLIRVGDPNQAINSTFTPANPIYFNWFCRECESQGNLTTMDRAGRSSKIIMDAANFLIKYINDGWQGGEHFSSDKSDDPSLDLPFRFQEIKPVESGDQQPNANPIPVGKGLELYSPDDVYQSLKLITERIVLLFSESPKTSAAILVRENRQGKFIKEQLKYLNKEHGIRVYDVGEAERQSKIPEEILKLLQFLDRPHSPQYLKAALEILEQREQIATQDLNALATIPEQFLYPTPLENSQKPHVENAKKYCRKLLRARLELPHYQLIPFLGMTLKYTGSELATVQKLSERINQQIAGNSSLKSTISVLGEIVSSERFEPVEDGSDDRYSRPKQLTIITMHKAKGLDWDYVFIPFLHKDIIPGESWIPNSAKFLGDFTLSEVARAQIRAALNCRHRGEILTAIPEPEKAYEQAKRLKMAEEFRLLYVAMTRAKKLLWISAEDMAPYRWNVFEGNGRDSLQKKEPSPVFTALQLHFPQCLVT
jgi:DNA helicase-2/ATP-dependent DNA helicase PcrA